MSICGILENPRLASRAPSGGWVASEFCSDARRSGGRQRLGRADVLPLIEYPLKGRDRHPDCAQQLVIERGEYEIGQTRSGAFGQHQCARHLVASDLLRRIAIGAKLILTRQRAMFFLQPFQQCVQEQMGNAPGNRPIGVRVVENILGRCNEVVQVGP